MSKSGYFLDAKEFNSNFKHLTDKTIPSSASKGLSKAIDELLADSINLPPQAPKDIGDLWGSRIKEKVKTSHNDTSVKGGFNIKYAHRHHEVPPGTFHYITTKGASQPGPKFMESKMIKYKDKYMWMVAEEIKRKGK